ncbi:MAG: putative helicase [Solirubrobacterales bacterium]|nr:putative helicase [Solirubrobacterales bacterium]
MTTNGYAFNPPPGWLVPPGNWAPPDGWTPDPNWPPAPPDWQFWIVAVPEAKAVAAEATPVLEVAPKLPEASTPRAVPAPALVQDSSSATDAETTCQALLARIAELEAEVTRLTSTTASLAEAVDLSDERVLQEVGIYRYHHPLENSAEYKEQLLALGEQIKELVKQGKAVLVSDMFTFNNSLARGRKMTGEFSKLMLRAYNAEADNCVRALRAGNVLTAKKRLDHSVTAIARLGSMMEMQVNPAYHQLRFRELELTADYLMKVQVEKEAAREERERLREERKAEQELALERERLTKERNHYVNALDALKLSGDEVAIAELAERLQDIDQAIEQNDFRAANIRAGYVYVISNTGALGPNVVKIGLTRRLEPMDRVRELGDASVPFPFDVHALFFSEDAVTVEADLHRAFASHRVNRVNDRREFFFATPAQVRRVLEEKVGNILEFTEEPEATQYLQSKGYWPESATKRTSTFD